MCRALSRPVLLALALTAAGCNGCNTVQVNQAKGSFVMSPLVLDFHTVCLNSTGEFDLTLQNEGRGTLNIKSAKFSNPAFSFLAPLPTSIAPEKEAVVAVGFTPTVAMDYSGQLTITTDSLDNATQSATLLGTGFSGAQRDFEVSCLCDTDATTGDTTCGLTGGGQMTEQPCAFLSFGNVVGGTSLSRTITVHNLGCEPVTFTQATFYDQNECGTPPATGCDPAAKADSYVSWFSLTPATPAAIRGGDSASYVVQFQPSIGPPASPIVRLKLASDDPTLPHNGQTVAGEWDVGLFAAAVAPALLVSETILTYYPATMGVPQTKTFVISNTGNSTLHVDSVSLVGTNGTTDFVLSGLPGNATSFDLGPTGMANAQVTVNATFTPTGSGTESATVTVTSAMSPPARVVKLIGGAVPQLAVVWIDPTDGTQHQPPIDFGQVATGGTAQRTVVLQNLGSADLIVSNVTTRDLANPTMADTSYTLAAFNSTTIAAGMSHNVLVNFADDVSLRNDSAKLAITSNDPMDTVNAGVRTEDLISEDSPDYKPIPDINVNGPLQTCQVLSLDGSSSTPSSPTDTLNYLWAITLKPNGSKATLSSTTSPMTAVVSPGCMGPDIPGVYVFSLTVGDQFPNNTNKISQSVTIN